MQSVAYDLHLHSCLSPCGDMDMTPNNIVNMAMLNELDVIALTDHNTCKNCPAILEAAAAGPVLVIPGMELCTVEEIHVVCLFAALSAAMAFDEYVASRQPFVANDEAIFGKQAICDGQDNITGVWENLLVNASEISIMEIADLMPQFDGVAFPAHIDKSAYSVMASLGDIPPECGFTCAEVARPEKLPQLEALSEIIPTLKILTDSDAHYLWDIGGREHFLHVREKTTAGVLESLRRGKLADSCGYTAI